MFKRLQRICATIVVTTYATVCAAYAGTDLSDGIGEAKQMNIECETTHLSHDTPSDFPDAFCDALKKGLVNRLSERPTLPETVRVTLSSRTGNSLTVDYGVQTASGSSLDGQAQIDIVDSELRPSMGDVLANEIARAIGRAD